MYRTSRRRATPAGRFSGPLVVSMRPMTPEQAIRATQITSRYRPVHGAPGPHRRSRRDRDRRPRRARLRRPGRDPRRRAPGVLGLRRDAPGGRGRLAAGADDHPRARPHVRDRRRATRRWRRSDERQRRLGRSGFEPPRRPRVSSRWAGGPSRRLSSTNVTSTRPQRVEVTFVPPRLKPTPYPAAVRQSSRAGKSSSPRAETRYAAAPSTVVTTSRNDVPSNTSAAASSAA